MSRSTATLLSSLACLLLTGCPDSAKNAKTGKESKDGAGASGSVENAASSGSKAPSGNETSVITRGPYPQAATENAIHLVWRTRQETEPVVKYGTSWSALTEKASGAAVKVRRTAAEGGTGQPLFAAPANTRQYEAHITGLKPDTKYYYAVCDGERPLSTPDETHYFTTLPAPGTPKPLLMWVVGDSGMANKAQEKVHAAMRTWLQKEKRSLDLYLHVGDMAYGEGLDTQFQLKFFQIYADTLQNTVCWPALGNHEGRTSNGPKGTGPYFDCYIVPAAGESGGVPSGGEQYYSFDIGRAHFISLNSFDTSRKADGPMAQWLKADLERTKQDWIIAFFHHPPYTKGSHDSDDIKRDKELVEMRENIMPILEGGGVDLVLAGHSHIYERSFLLDGAYMTPTTADGFVLNDGDGNPAGSGAYQKSAGLPPHQGSISIVAGHGGATLGRKLKPSPVMCASILEFGSVLLDLKGDTLTGLMLNSDAEVRDTFQLIKRGKIELARIAKPKPPGPFSGSLLPKPKEESKKEQSTSAKLPEQFAEIIPKGAEWEYLAGSAPDSGWTTSTGGGWKTGKAGIGYGDGDDATEITGMKGKYGFLCARRAFELTGKEDLSKLGLMVSYDDGFICYINGTEVARDNVASGNLKSAKGVKSHSTDGKFDYIPLPRAAASLKPGRNIIAFEIHNDDLNSSDLSLHPSLILTKGSEVAASPAEGDKDDESAD